MSSKSLEEKIIDIIIKSVYQYYYLDYYNDEKAVTQAQTIFDQTGFVSLDIENSKALYTLFILQSLLKIRILWNFVQEYQKRI